MYRDEDGRTPVMAAVEADARTLMSGQKRKAYLGPEGDTGFIGLLAEIALGSPLCRSDLQTPGGTGARRLGTELLARSHPGASVWIGSPTWPNHAPI